MMKDMRRFMGSEFEQVHKILDRVEGRSPMRQSSNDSFKRDRRFDFYSSWNSRRSKEDHKFESSQGKKCAKVFIHINKER